MGLSSKQFSGDGLDWSQGRLRNGEMEIAKPHSPAVHHGRQQRQVAAAAAAPPVRCPRCDSINTKFCYYNNYSRTQPRHFCKACRRHWTNGGTLRNVPVGGGRKNKRVKTSQTSTTTATSTNPTNSGHEEEILQQLSTSYAPDMQMCQGLLQPSPSSSSSDYFNSSVGKSGSILDSLLSSLPPVPLPLPMMDPFHTTTNSSYSSFPFLRQLEVDSAEEDRTGITTSMVDNATESPWQRALLPTCGFSHVNLMEPSSTGGYWNSWDELTGFGASTTPQNGLP